LTYSTTPDFRPTEEISECATSLGPGDEIAAIISRALSEDIGTGDVTTNCLVPAESWAKAKIIARQDGVLSGLNVAQAVFMALHAETRFNSSLSDGVQVRQEQVLLELAGPARTILTGERTALNFLGRMSGIATLTRQLVDAVKGTRAVILDTRKTAPGLRAIDKLAIRHGGGQNHRLGLYDMVLIKNNHIAYAGSLSNAVRRVRESGNALEIEVEARSIQELQEALALDVKKILLDNMSIDELRRAVALNDGQAKLEASGNVTLTNVREIAETGVDFISVGALTHSAKAFDVSLRLIC
jgi:nicotinate-nucleotide pyrophosphorylase (carboxylating)